MSKALRFSTGMIVLAGLGLVAMPALATTTATAYVSDTLRYDYPNGTSHTFNFSQADPAATIPATPPGTTATAAITDATVKAMIAPPIPGGPTYNSYTDAYAMAKAGELHVSASYNDSNSPYAVNSYLTASARFTDSFAILAPVVGPSYFTGSVIIDGIRQATGSGAVISDVDFKFYDSDPNVIGANVIGDFHVHEDRYGNGFVHQLDSASNAGHYSDFFNHTLNFDVNFTPGEDVYVVATASCTVSTGTIAAITGATDEACDLSHSVYWEGIQSIHDSNGLVDLSQASISGSSFNYLLASPNAPNAAAVPEPTSWAMLLVGFGAIGGTIRARRRIFTRA